MDKQKKKEQVSEQEEFDKFLKYLSSDSEAREAFVNLSDEYVIDIFSVSANTHI
jgi:hypothetical protein